MSGGIEEYIKLYRALKLPDAAIEIARGEWESERMEVVALSAI